jgi:hypothetical protein
MSLWTPGGEHRVPPAEPAGATPEPPPEPARDDIGPLDDLSPEEAAQARALAEEMAEVRRQLSEVPADVVVANHVMGLYELAAIHLSRQPPAFEDARLAIDAMGAVVDGLAGRLGEAEQTLRDALRQIRMVYVQLQGGHPEGDAETG